MGGAMSQEHAPRAAGAVIALTIIAGAVIGTMSGQPSLGVVIGIALGVAVALVVWLRDRQGR